MAATSRWQLSIAYIRLRTTDISAVMTCMSMPKLLRQHAARIADAGHAVDGVADRQRVQHRAARAGGIVAAGREHAGDVAFADTGARDIDRRRHQVAARPAGRHRDDHLLELKLGRALGEIDGLAERLLGRLKIDHRAAFDAAGERVAEADDIDAYGCAGAAPAAGACGFNRAIRQAILLVPTSSAAISAERFGDKRLGLGRQAELEDAHARPPFFAFLTLSLTCSCRACAAFSDCRTVTRSGSRRSITTMSRERIFWSRSSAISRMSAASAPALGQADVEPVAQSQVPAALADQDRGAHLVADAGEAVEQVKEFLGLRLGAATDHQRQLEQLRHRVGFQHGAVVGDHRYAAVLLPQRERLALLDADLQFAGIELQHGGVGDPRIGLQPLARTGHARGTDSEVRPVIVGGGEHLFPADILVAGDRDRHDAEADRIGGLVADILQAVDDRRDVVALDDAVAQAGEHDHDRGGDAGAARHAQARQPETVALHEPLEDGSAAMSVRMAQRAPSRADAQRRSAGARAAARRNSAIERCVLDHPSH